MCHFFAQCNFIIAVIFGAIAIQAAANAEQQVTLQTGATLVGTVSMEGDQLAIDVDGAKLHFSFTDVATVTSVGTNSPQQAERLLLKGLEAQLLYDGEQKEIGLLAEAHRLAPDDARVTYWYARSLANAGLGKAAREAFAPHRDEIATAYPGLADRLAEQIENRMQIESLPVKLVRQIDAINAAVGGVASFFTDNEPRSAYFRLVDQHGEPIESSAFQISCNGQNERLQSFDAGYHLFTYVCSRHSSNSPCRLQVTQVGLQSKTFEFTGTGGGTVDAGVFQVKRMSDEDRRPVVVKVVDVEGEPLVGVSVTFSATSRSRSGSRIPATKTDDKGRVETQLFPNKYSCYTDFADYNRATQSFEIKPDALEQDTIELKLHRLIAATVKIKWRTEITGSPTRPQSPGENVSTGEIELRNGAQGHDGRTPYSAVPWIRLLQKDDQLQLQFIEQPYYGPTGRTGITWIGRVDTPEDPAVDFEAIDLTKIDDWKKKAKLLRPNLQATPGRHQPVIVVAERGALYVGKINSRDMHGRYTQVFDFKILVTEQGDSVDAQ